MSENTDYETLKAERDAALNTCSLIAEALGITGAVAGDTIAKVQQLVAENAAAYRIHELESQWENRAPTSFAYDAACSALHIYQERAEKAEAALSAANERLSKPVVLPDDGLDDCINIWPDNWRNDFDTGYNFGVWRCEQNIKSAGFAVEE